MGWERNYTTQGNANQLRQAARGMGGGYSGFAAQGLEQEASDIEANNAMGRQAAMQQQMGDRDREMFERNMMMQEQQRRAFDSQTQRMGEAQQAQKFGLLSNLISGQQPQYGNMSMAFNRPPVPFNYRRSF